MGDRPAVNPGELIRVYPDPASVRRGFGVSGFCLSVVLSLRNLLGRVADYLMMRIGPKEAIASNVIEPFDLFRRCNDRYSREMTQHVAPPRLVETYAPPRPTKLRSLEDYARQANPAPSRESSYLRSRAAVDVSDAEDEVLDASRP